MWSRNPLWPLGHIFGTRPLTESPVLLPELRPGSIPLPETGHGRPRYGEVVLIDMSFQRQNQCPRRGVHAPEELSTVPENVKKCRSYILFVKCPKLYEPHQSFPSRWVFRAIV